jgi:glycosyltransferase involved in cell wall biosynthesis
MVHPAAGRTDISRVVHVTHTNDLFWDCGSLPTVVIEHGVIDPGHRWSGDIDAMAVVVNEPLRRGRVTGTDLLERFGAVGPVDLFGMGVDAMTAAGCSWLRTHEDLPQATMHTELARRRLYVHPFRWTSLGLSLIEAMLLGMPVVALATTETPDAVPAGCGIVSNDVACLARAAARLLVDRDECAALGTAARDHALARYGLARFLDDWDRLMKEVVG